MLLFKILWRWRGTIPRLPKLKNAFYMLIRYFNFETERKRKSISHPYIHSKTSVLKRMEISTLRLGLDDTHYYRFSQIIKTGVDNGPLTALVRMD